MTVGELIEHLKQFNSALPAVTEGFDGYGYNDAGQPKAVTIVRISGISQYDDSTNSHPIGSPFQAVYIGS